MEAISIEQRVIFLIGIGLNEKEISVVLDISEHTINYWKRTKSDFLSAFRKGQRESMKRVEKKLIHGSDTN